MVVVVPAFAIGQKRQEPVIHTIILNFIASLSEAMSYGVNAKGDMIYGYSAQKKAIDQ